MEDFTRVKDKTSEGIQEFRIFLKSKIILVIDLEIKQLQEEIKTNYAENIQTLLRGYLMIVRGDIDNHHCLATDIFKINHTALLKHIHMT